MKQPYWVTHKITGSVMRARDPSPSSSWKFACLLVWAIVFFKYVYGVLTRFTDVPNLHIWGLKTTHVTELNPAWNNIWILNFSLLAPVHQRKKCFASKITYQDISYQLFYFGAWIAAKICCKDIIAVMLTGKKFCVDNDPWKYAFLAFQGKLSLPIPEAHTLV